MRKKAFSLVELLVVAALMLILAGVLFPVFGSAKRRAIAISSVSNFRSVVTAGLLYVQDYDDVLMPPRYIGDNSATPLTDRTWVQLVLPYALEYDLFISPADPSGRATRTSLFDADLRVGDLWARYHEASKRSNVGYNHLYMAPMMLASNGEWTVRARSMASIETPETTLMFGESVFSVDTEGNPRGGGSFLITPPCRFSNAGGVRRDSFGVIGHEGGRLYDAGQRWTGKDGPRMFGGLWPWHDGRLSVAYADGHVSLRTIQDVTTGCDVQSGWRGLIVDTKKYVWDLE